MAVYVGGVCRSHGKSEIFMYKTVDGKVTVLEDELSNFTIIKMRLFHRKKLYCWPHKDVNSIKDCLNLLNECGENIPTFVENMNQKKFAKPNVKHLFHIWFL